jgi:hypothetical protein
MLPSEPEGGDNGGGDRANRETDMTGLSYAEHLLVWSWRKIVMGYGGCPLIAREFSLLCGEDGGEVLATLHTFLQALAYAGRRRLEVGYPGYTSLTVDERKMLVLIAAAQSGDATRLEAICEFSPGRRFAPRWQLRFARWARR